jgi:hypothetical protein
MVENSSLDPNGRGTVEVITNSQPDLPERTMSRRRLLALGGGAGSAVILAAIAGNRRHSSSLAVDDQAARERAALGAAIDARDEKIWALEQAADQAQTIEYHILKGENFGAAILNGTVKGPGADGTEASYHHPFILFGGKAAPGQRLDETALQTMVLGYIDSTSNTDVGWTVALLNYVPGTMTFERGDLDSDQMAAGITVTLPHTRDAVPILRAYDEDSQPLLSQNLPVVPGQVVGQPLQK